MPVIVTRGPNPDQDSRLAQIVAVLERYNAAHPGTRIEIYRHGEFLIRIRVINPAFAGRSWTDRDEEVWTFLRELPEDVVWDIHILLCLTPEESKTHLGSLEFDDPIPAPL